MVYKLLIKKTGSKISLNELPAEELHKPVIKISKRRKYMWDLKTRFGPQI